MKTTPKMLIQAEPVRCADRIVCCFHDLRTCLAFNNTPLYGLDLS
jgi:hypothetical protein